MVAHRLEFVIGGRSAFEPHDKRPGGVVANERHGIHCGICCGNRGTETSQFGPRGSHTDQSTFFLLANHCWHRAEAAVAYHQAGAALAEFELHARVAKQRTIVVGVHIDEAGRKGATSRIDLVARGLADRPHRSDALSSDGNVGLDGSGTGPVEQGRITNDEISHSRTLVVRDHELSGAERTTRRQWFGEQHRWSDVGHCRSWCGSSRSGHRRSS